MKKAFRDVLQHVLRNAVHITCFAHIFNLVGETWRLSMKDADQVVAQVKSIFSRSGQRRSRFHDALVAANIELPKAFPAPVITRWGTWFRAIQYINLYFDQLKSFVDQDLEIDDTVALVKLRELFEKSETLKQDVKFIANHCGKIITTLEFFERQEVSSTEVYDKVSDLYFWLSQQEDYHRNISEENCQTAQKLFKVALDKLKKYFIDGHQPGTSKFNLTPTSKSNYFNFS